MLVSGCAWFDLGLEWQHGCMLLRWLLALVAVYCGTVCSALVVWVIRPNQRRTQQALKHLADRTGNGEHISHSPLLPYQMSDPKHFFHFLEKPVLSFSLLGDSSAVQKRGNNVAYLSLNKENSAVKYSKYFRDHKNAESHYLFIEGPAVCLSWCLYHINKQLSNVAWCNIEQVRHLAWCVFFPHISSTFLKYLSFFPCSIFFLLSFPALCLLGHCWESVCGGRSSGRDAA